MSIINEALKKVQNKRHGQDLPLGQNPPTRDRQRSSGDSALKNPGMPHLPSANSLHKGLNFSSRMLIVIPLVILILILASQIFKFFPLSLPPKKEMAPAVNIEVSGIMTMENKKMALINNEIYEIGDTLEGMTLMSISEEAVHMLQDGRLVSYKVKK